MPTLDNYGAIANVMVTFDGDTAPLKVWSRSLGIPYNTVAMRYKRGIRDPKLLLHKPRTTRNPASLGEATMQQRRSERTSVLSIFPAEVVSELQQVAALSGDPLTGEPMPIEEVIVTLVRDNLRRYWKLRENK